MNEETDQPSTTRRALLIAGGAAAVGAAAVVAAPAAEAASGSNMIVGRGNVATSSTVLSINSVGTGFSVQNANGTAASFISSLATGFAGSTNSGNGNGTVAVNRGTTQGSGAAFVASGQLNTGATIATAGPGRFGLIVRHTASTDPAVLGDSAAALCLGGKRDGIVGETLGSPFNVSGVSGFHLNGGAGVYGSGGFGLQGYSEEATGAGVYAQADGTLAPSALALLVVATGGASAIEATGNSKFFGNTVFNGDITVTGTVFCNNAIAPIPAKAANVAASRIQRRAGRTASKLRPTP